VKAKGELGQIRPINPEVLSKAFSFNEKAMKEAKKFSKFN